MALAQQPAAVALAPKWTEKQFTGIDTVEQQILILANQERKKAGLGPVTGVVTLTVAARQHSQEMGVRKYFAHESPEPRWRQPWQRCYNAGYWGQQVGENIASVQNAPDQSPKGLATHFMKLWMESAPHRANLLTPTWTISGVGVTKTGNTYHATQLFATPLVTLEGALLTRVSGEMVTLTISGALRSGAINVWVNEAHQGTVMPQNGKFETSVNYPRKSGAYTVMVGVGTQVVWQATLDTNQAQKAMLTGIKNYRAGIVTGTDIAVDPFTGMRLTGILRFPAGQQAIILRDEATVLATVTANKDGVAAFDCVLPKRDAYYTIGIGHNNRREDMVFIDTTAPLTDAFLGRP